MGQVFANAFHDGAQTKRLFGMAIVLTGVENGYTVASHSASPEPKHLNQ
jgi:hypothetical protein